jgi:phosphopantothenoylcysteine decarboxylase / phosphopantothenate---cysteine ligase
MPVVVLGVTGCIGAYKACEVLRELQKRSVDVHPVFIDQFELGENSDIRHISLADAAHLLLVAPATANVIGKFAQGLADDALSTLFLATKAPVLVAPAMNVNIVEPGSGYLACGWLGRGRLAEVPEIVQAALDVLARRQTMAGQRVLVTAGPTVEDIDPVRFVSNRSSGRMGYRLAEAARDRGATVTLVSGPTELPAPAGIERVSVRSAEEMARAVASHAADVDVVVMAAAVSDYRPAVVSDVKVKKADGGLTLEMVRTTDILRTLGQAKGSRFLVGFAAETDHLQEHARRKLRDKNVDLMVANTVGQEASGFASDQNAAVLMDADGEVDVPLTSKRELAERIWDRVAELRARTPVKA